MENLKFKKTIFGKKPDGWEDMGAVKRKPVIIDGKNGTEYPLCGVCNGKLRVGKGENKIFKYCPDCEILN